ncbi:hypothetical protein niasHS_005402 [Heterodera schachtii]|uniref:Rho GTPase-activating protein 26 n=1 Tax=Heterodera schachtii TaxID=97005 RepID=A0ABD2J969_HETSC
MCYGLTSRKTKVHQQNHRQQQQQKQQHQQRQLLKQKSADGGKMPPRRGVRRPPLEFADALADSPFFRQTLFSHEAALDDTSKSIKGIEGHCRKILDISHKLSRAYKGLATALCELKIDGVGSAISDDNCKMANYFKDFGNLISSIEEERVRTAEGMERYLMPLQQMVDKIAKVKTEEKHKYSKESNKFYQALERNLSLKITTARKSDFREADAHLAINHRSFCQASLNFVHRIKFVQESIRFEFLHCMGSFLYQMKSFYQMANEIQKDFSLIYNDVCYRVEKAKKDQTELRAQIEGTKRNVLEKFLKHSVFVLNSSSSNCGELSSDLSTAAVAAASAAVGGGAEGSAHIRQGYLFVLEMRSLLSKAVQSRGTPTRNYCVYSKESRILTLIPVNSLTVKTDMKGCLDQTISYKLKNCARRPSDSIDRRFCFDVCLENKNEPITMQALSESDFVQWLNVMDAHEPEQYGALPSVETSLDERGFAFVRHCISVLEEKGIKEQGIYRNCGVNSKVQKLMQLALDPSKKSDKFISTVFASDWEIKTISSAVKTFLRSLKEPLLTYHLHQCFITSAKIADLTRRRDFIHWFIYQLPPSNKTMLELIIRHLRRIADCSSDNLMPVENLAVCFGPTLLRPKEETMAAIFDIKFCNVVVEVLIDECALIFGTEPRDVLSGPPKPVNNYSFGALSEEIGQKIAAVAAIASDQPHFRHHSTASVLTAASSSSAGGPTPSVAGSNPFLSPSTGRDHSQHSVAGESLSAFIDATSSIGSGVVGSSCCSATVFDESGGLQQQQHHHRQFFKATASESSDCCAPELFMSAARLADDNTSAIIHHGMAAEFDHIDDPYDDSRRPSPLSLRIPPQMPTSARFNYMINTDLPFQHPRRVKTLYPCSAQHDTELSFEKDQIITNVYQSKEEGWLVGTLNGRTGLIPANYVIYIDSL